MQASGSLGSSGLGLCLSLSLCVVTLTLPESTGGGFCSVPLLGFVSHGDTKVMHLREAAPGRCADVSLCLWGQPSPLG